MRTTLVSTSKLKIFKKVITAFYITINIIGFGCAIVPFIIHDRHYILIFIPVIVYFSIRGYRETKRLKSISFDDSSVYYEKDGYEVQIPFEDIKYIEVIGVDVFSIELFRPTQDGDRIWFKTSIKYPFNFRKKDAEVNALRDKIDRYKRTLPEKNFAGLPSYNI